jgi:hypothetical protein
MLLLGSQMYGVCFWDKMAADERLGLGHKLDGAVKDGSKVGDKHFPQGTPTLLECLKRSLGVHLSVKRMGWMGIAGLSMLLNAVE